MINIGNFQRCVCQDRGFPHPLCDDKLTLQENGIKVRLSKKSGEDAIALVIDGCICKDLHPKCDGMFILGRKNHRWMLLVELKGIDLHHAVAQLAYTRHNRQEYLQIKNHLLEDGYYQVIEKAFIVSNYLHKKNDLKKLEEAYQIRVYPVYHKAAAAPVPDLRDYLTN